MIAVLEKYGLPGIVIAGLAWFVLYLIKEHRAERKEWRSSMDKQFTQSNALLRSIKTILDHRK